MGSHTVLGTDQQQQSPCDTCRMRKGCADNDLACRAYVHWMSYGLYMEPSGIPSRAYSLCASADSEKIVGLYNKARSAEEKMQKRAKMRRISRSHTKCLTVSN